MIAIGGEWGTLSEIAHARAFGRHVVALHSWRVESATPIAHDPGIQVADDPAAAVEAALKAARG